MSWQKVALREEHARGKECLGALCPVRGGGGKTPGSGVDRAGADTVYRPPYMSGKTYYFTQRVGAAGWQGDPSARLTRPAYTDRWPGREAYLAFLRETLTAYCLCSGRTVHICPCGLANIPPCTAVADDLLGEHRFRNEIIWAYNSGGRSRDSFSRKHDTIFYYRAGKRAAFYPDAVGERRGRERRNNLRRGIENGRVYFAINVGRKEYRYYEDDILTPGDVWTDIPVLQQRDPLRVGYETQKPPALLERILLCSTRPGDAVLDLFSGSGTTAEVAAQLGRIPLAADPARDALHLFRRRVRLAGGHYKLPDPPAWQGEETAGDWRLTRASDIARITFLRCEAEDIPSPANPMPLLPDTLWAADAWSAGYLSEGVYTASVFFARTRERPALPRQAEVAVPPGARPAVSFTDAAGRTFYRVWAE